MHTLSPNNCDYFSPSPTQVHDAALLFIYWVVASVHAYIIGSDVQSVYCFCGLLLPFVPFASSRQGKDFTLLCCFAALPSTRASCIQFSIQSDWKSCRQKDERYPNSVGECLPHTDREAKPINSRHLSYTPLTFALPHRNIIGAYQKSILLPLVLRIVLYPLLFISPIALPGTILFFPGH
ncbi:hypothetical protein F4815DRAFT_70862 [Daldinia loculata]|nr:hypothetical protein F4815DRAFT_70862 [Daldinia loculata]